MARMHSRKKGKSSSKKPIKKTLPVWLRYKPNEVELLIAKLSKEGKISAFDIGDKQWIDAESPTTLERNQKEVKKIIKQMGF